MLASFQLIERILALVAAGKKHQTPKKLQTPSPQAYIFGT